MNSEALKIEFDNTSSWIDKINLMTNGIADRATRYDRDGEFIYENYQLLKQQRFFSMAIPAGFGGGGATYQTLCDTIRTLGYHCGSTGLAFAMHSHPVMVNVFKALRGDEKSGAAITKIAASELVIAGTGANDWLQSSGTATPVEGGYEVIAHKRFVSGAPGANLFVTSAVVPAASGTDEPDQVIHFAVPFSTPGIKIQNNWETLGMRGTGSNDVLLHSVFVPEGAVVVKRAVGRWHPMWDVILPVALPLIVSCYVGLAEAAADLAIQAAANKPFLAAEIGQLQNELTVAQLALGDMITRCNDLDFKPDIANTDAILSRKTIAATAVKNTVECAASIVGGPGFFLGHKMERIIRDVRAMHFHPLPDKRQQIFSGRRALGMEAIA